MWLRSSPRTLRRRLSRTSCTTLLRDRSRTTPCSMRHRAAARISLAAIQRSRGPHGPRGSVRPAVGPALQVSGARLAGDENADADHRHHGPSQLTGSTSTAVSSTPRPAQHSAGAWCTACQSAPGPPRADAPCGASTANTPAHPARFKAGGIELIHAQRATSAAWSPSRSPGRADRLRGTPPLRSRSIAHAQSPHHHPADQPVHPHRPAHTHPGGDPAAADIGIRAGDLPRRPDGDLQVRREALPQRGSGPAPRAPARYPGAAGPLLRRTRRLARNAPRRPRHPRP